MKNKFLAVLTICLSVIASTTLFAMEKTDTELFYFGRDIELNNAIYVENSKYYIPLRECAEQIGATVEYVPNNIIRVYFNDGNVMQYYLDTNKMNFNTLPEIESSLKNINGVSYVDAKQFYNLLECDVIEVDQNGKKILKITKMSYITHEEQYIPSDYKNTLSLLNGIEKNKNSAVSPISLKLAFAMIANGTTGQTQQQILNVLGYNTIEELNQFVSNEALKWTVSDHNKENEGMIQFANGLWYNSGKIKTKNIFHKNFEDAVKNNLNGVVNTVTNNTAVAIINEWARQATNGMFSQIIQSADFETALINTTYFKCSWRNKFRPDITKKDIFYNIDNTQSQIDFMHQMFSTYYCETNGWQMLALPYADNNYTMYLFLPEKGNQQTLNNDTINRLLQFQEYLETDITIPKFDIEYQCDLTETLKNMGVQAMFENTSDFNTMYADGKGKYITNVFQKVKIIVDEQGTEASGVTMLMAGRDKEPIMPPVFKADRPFIYMITKTMENGQKEVLFVGQYVTGNK